MKKTILTLICAWLCTTATFSQAYTESVNYDKLIEDALLYQSYVVSCGNIGIDTLQLYSKNALTTTQYEIELKSKGWIFDTSYRAGKYQKISYGYYHRFGNLKPTYFMCVFSYRPETDEPPIVVEFFGSFNQTWIASIHKCLVSMGAKVKTFHQASSIETEYQFVDNVFIIGEKRGKNEQIHYSLSFYP